MYGCEASADLSSQWKWPDIEGLDCFKGKLLHSARWYEPLSGLLEQ